MSEWHWSWQELADPQRVEVVIGPHRADMVGDDGMVIELQHSFLSPEKIREREEFYGRMVWVFDANSRFEGFQSGSRFFFSFGRTEHVQVCTKPVFLDFGSFIVEVEAITRIFDGSGFGLIHDREWFASRFFPQSRRIGPMPKVPAGSNALFIPPFSRTEHRSIWIGEPGNSFTDIPQNTPYIDLSYRFGTAGHSVPAWEEIIDHHRSLAAGWTKEEFQQMMRLLRARPMVLEGTLRLMPAPRDRLKVSMFVFDVEQGLKCADGHISAGRLPVLKSSTREYLLQRALEYERYESDV